MRPEFGGRVELLLTQGGDDDAEYAVSLSQRDGEWRGTAKAKCAGGVEGPTWSAPSTPPPDWLVALAQTLLRGAVRTKLSEADWPRRVTRWRPGPEERS
jgi:hypothetical protein